MAGSTPIGWGDVDDDESSRALQRAIDRGVNFIDTADFYGLGHSEELIGKTVGNRHDVIVATKVGHRLNPDGAISLDYSKKYIVGACEASLKRLRRDRIDYYQLHSARVSNFEQGECFDALDLLKEQGKIGHWGVSMNTFHPEPEAEYLFRHSLGQGLQLVLNIINQRAVPLLRRASECGYGIIVRMPLQFGLLTGKLTPETRFEPSDHRSFRLTPEILQQTLPHLGEVWRMAERYGVSKTLLSLSFCTSFPDVSTIIPGMKTSRQAEENTGAAVQLSREDLMSLRELYRTELHTVVGLMERRG